MKNHISAAILSVSGLSLTDDEKRLLSKFNPLGISLFARNISTRIQVKELIKDIKNSIGRDDVIIAVDQEGGRVRRLVEPEFRAYASQYVLGKIEDEYSSKDAQTAIREHANLISNDLQELGINMNYAPVLDLLFEETAPVLKSRCFGTDEKTVAHYGKIMVDEYIKNGICPCIKHMPGHGRVSVDPHLNLPVLDLSLKELTKDFYPFQQLNYSPAGMTAHVVIKEIDDKLPVTQSPEAIRKVIRGIIGFEGLLISDAIDMKALKGSLGEKSETSIAAGCDVVCYCGGDSADAEEVCRKSGIMSDKSMIRFEKIKNLFHNGYRVSNIGVVAKEYETLTGRIEKYQDNYDATEVLNKMTLTKNKGVN